MPTGNLLSRAQMCHNREKNGINLIAIWNVFFLSDQTQPLANNIYIYHFHIGKQYQYLSLSTLLIQHICSWEAASLMEVL